MTEPRRTYRFGPIERHGFLGAVRAGQASVVIGGALLALVTLGGSPSPGRAAVAVAMFATSVAVVVVPLGGRTLEQWLPVATAWLLRRAAGATELRAQTPAAGLSATNGAHPTLHERDLTLPRALRGVRIVELPYRARSVGAMSERGGRLLTAVLACQVVSFALLDPEAQERSLSNWGGLLSACADTPVRRVQWLERTGPAEGDELARWLRSQRDPGIPRTAPLVSSYLELIERTVHVSQEHEILIAVQVDAHRVRSRGRDAVAGTLMEETERIADGLRRAGGRIQGALTPSHLAALCRTAFDPYVRGELGGAVGPEDSQTWSEHTAWPVAATEGWDHYRADGAVHATYWMAGWPRVDVGSLFLDPLLSHAGAVRTVAVTFEPLPAERSIREVEAQVTRDQADQSLKARFGQAETARQQQAYGATRRREAELAAGYGEVRFTGFITVSAPTIEQLQSSCADVKRDAARARVELHAMYGQQADAFTFTLPLCRGLR